MGIYRSWRQIMWFLGLLLVALAFDRLLNWSRSTFLIAALDWEGKAWFLFRNYGGLEAVYWVLCFSFFAAAGAILAEKGESRTSSTVFAILLGVAFTMLSWLDGPRVMYSHAPLWLWVLAWGDLYIPTIAGALGVLLWPSPRVRHLRGPHAA